MQRQGKIVNVGLLQNSLRCGSHDYCVIFALQPPQAGFLRDFVEAAFGNRLTRGLVGWYDGGKRCLGNTERSG